jgi:hypothetical protein
MRKCDGCISIAASGRFFGKKVKVPTEQNDVVAAL